MPTIPLWLNIVLMVLLMVGWVGWFLQHRKRRRDAARLEEIRQDRDKLKLLLQGNEARLLQGIEKLGAELWEWDLTGKGVHVSPFILETTGYTAAAFPSTTVGLLELVHPEDRDQVRKMFRGLLVGRHNEIHLEVRVRFASGEFHWIQTRVISRHDDGPRVSCLVGSFHDITERISAEEERDRLFNLSIDMLAVWGFDGKLQQVNPAWVRVLGWSRDDLMDKPLLFFVHPEDQDLTREAFEAIYQGDPIEELDMRFRCRNGSYLWLSWSSFPYPDRQVVFSVVKDITHNKLAERKLLDYQERLRSLSSQLSLVEDRQRKILASAIHDGLAQQLFGIRAKVTLMKFPEKVPDLAALVNETLGIIDETMTQARTLSFELFPPVLHEVGLDAALNWLGHQFQESTGIHCRVTAEGDGPELGEDIRTMAFQSVRELLANIRKHSQTEECSISMNYVEGFLTVLVEDRGQGFEFNRARDRTLDKESQGGFGLFSIRERMRSIGGRMLVDSQPGKGCRVFLTFPNDYQVPASQVGPTPEY